MARRHPKRWRRVLHKLIQCIERGCVFEEEEKDERSSNSFEDATVSFAATAGDLSTQILDGFESVFEDGEVLLEPSKASSQVIPNEENVVGTNTVAAETGPSTSKLTGPCSS